MSRKLPKVLKNFRVKVKSVGVNLFGFSVNFEMKVKKPRKARSRKALVPIQPIQPTGNNIVIETIHDLADKERRLAVRQRNWETALLTALVQGWAQQERKKQSSG